MLVLKIILVKGSFVKKTVYIYSFGNIFPPLFIFILFILNPTQKEARAGTVHFPKAASAPERQAGLDQPGSACRG